MSGIFKGDSIYKSGGGGGGGYKDGGELVDGDFIKVENNTVSSYDNVSRDPVNFYFDIKDGEVINSIIEITTQVNATVNIYVVKNGFYFLLSNVGGNTINASEKYKINVTGESFDIEKEDGGGASPDYAEIDGNIYGVLNVNGILWLKNDYRGVIENIPYGVSYGHYYYYIYDMPEDFNIKGWRLPTNTEQINLLNFCNNDYNTFVSNMNIGLYGVQSNKTGVLSYYGTAGFIANKSREIVALPPNISTSGYRSNERYILRLVYEL